VLHDGMRYDQKISYATFNLQLPCLNCQVCHLQKSLMQVFLNECVSEWDPGSVPVRREHSLVQDLHLQWSLVAAVCCRLGIWSC